MTEHHLTDDALSALVDGQDGHDDDARHAAGCPDCGARLTALRAVAAEVAAPVPPAPDDWVDRAVAAALDAADEAPGAGVTTLAGRRRPPAAWLAPVAAVLLLLVGVVAVVGRSGPADDTDDVAFDALALEPDTVGDPGSGAAGGLVDLGDLGTVDGPEALRGLLAPVLGGDRRTAAAEGAEPDASDDTAEAMEAPEEDGPPTPETMRAPATGEPREGDGAPVGQCLAAVRADDTGLVELLVAATAIWRDTAAVVYGFATDDDHLTWRVYVLDASSCAVLEVLSFRS